MLQLTRTVRYWFTVAGSNWIYANKYDQIIQSVNKGKLKICPEVSHIDDVTIRMHSALMDAHVVLCEDYNRATNLLYSLSNKLRHIEPMPTTTQLTVSTQSDQIVSDELIQLSEHLKYKQQYAKMAKQPLNIPGVINEQNQIRLYNLKQAFREKITNHKLRNGFGYVISVNKDTQVNISDYIREGFDVIFMYNEAGHHTGRIIRQAEESKIPYEILPGPSQLISALAASGFPADRFGIEYFPCIKSNENIQQLLSKRKSQNFSIAIMDSRANLQRFLRRVIVIFGEHQLVYVVTDHKTVRKEVRRAAGECLKTFEDQPLPNKTQMQNSCVVVIAPYAMDYNEALKERLFQKRQAIDEIVDDDEDQTTLRLRKLQEKIKSLQEPKKYKIHGIEAAHYLRSIIQDDVSVTQLLQKILRIGEKDAQRLINKSKQLGQDVLQIESNQFKKQK